MIDRSHQIWNFQVSPQKIRYESKRVDALCCFRGNFGKLKKAGKLAVITKNKIREWSLAKCLEMLSLTTDVDHFSC